MCGNRLQLTLALFKPDITAQPLIVQAVRAMILERGMFFVRSKEDKLSRKRAGDFYLEHAGKFFHNRLVSFMSSGPICAHVLAGPNVIEDWRNLMGPTKVLRTIHEHPESIRGRFGLTDTRNCTHGSDSPESAYKEIRFFFPDFDIPAWFSKEEASFREGRVKYLPEKCLHVIHR